MGSGRQASLATVAGATAVETGHVNAIQVIVHAAPRGARLVLSVFLIRPSIGRGGRRQGGGHKRGMMGKEGGVGTGRGNGRREGDPRETTESVKQRSLTEGSGDGWKGVRRRVDGVMTGG